MKSIFQILLTLIFNKWLLACMLFCLLYLSAYTQTNKKNITKFNGSVSIADNFYSANGIEARQPGNMLIGIVRANLTLFKQIQLPFELYYTTQQTTFQQPFNQFGVSPKINSWLTLHGGYFSTRFSDLSFGDLRMLGGGVELSPGNFRFKAIYGRTRKAIEPNKVSYSPEVYEQNAYGMSIGYGDESKNFFNINMFHAIDDSNSIKTDTMMVAPNENLVTTLGFGMQLGNAASVKGEVGVSAYTHDTKAEQVDNVKIPEYVFTPNISSAADAAAKLSFNIKPSRYWSIRLLSRWIGPGYKTLGYALMPKDLMEFSLAPTVRLLSNKLSIRVKAGVRYNNLHEQRISSTNRFTGLFSANYQINKLFGISMNFNKNQIESSHKNDTLRISNIFNSVSVSPRWSFNGLGGSNNVILSYSYQDVADKNIYTSEISNNNTNSVYALHSLAFPTSWSLSTSVLYNNTKLANLSSQIFRISEGISRQFFNKLLNISANMGINFIKTTNKSNQFVFGLNASYSLKKYGNIRFNISNNNYKGPGDVIKDYNELYGSILYNIYF